MHARDPQTGRPTPDPAVYGEFLPALADTGAVINITTGGSTRMSLDERLAAALRFRPELASLNMGSMNFLFSGPAARYRQWKFDWERDYLLGSEVVIFSNTFRQITRTLTELGQDGGTRFEFECYDLGHLYTLAHFLDLGLVETPMLIQCIFGVLGGMGSDPENLSHLVSIADKLFGDDYYLSAFAAGAPDGLHHRRRAARRARARGPGGQPVPEPRRTGQEQRRSGDQGCAPASRARAAGRDARAGPRDAERRAGCTAL